MANSAKIHTLLDEFINTVPDLLAALVVDFNGFMIAKTLKKQFDEELIGGITTLLDQTLNRIKRITQSEHGSGSFTIDHFRLFYIQLGSNTGALLVLIGDNYSHIDNYVPYSHIIADKISLMLNHFDVPCEIPKVDKNANLILNANSRSIAIIGSKAVGKTALLRKICINDFIEEYQPTIGVSLVEKKFELTKNDERKVNIIDLSSLKSFGKVRRYFLHYSNAILIMFDYSREETLEKVESWIMEANKFADVSDLPYVIVGNKIDLNKNRNGLKTKAENIAIKNNCRFFESSMLTGEGVGTVLAYLYNQIFLDSGNKKRKLSKDKEAEFYDTLGGKLAKL